MHVHGVNAGVMQCRCHAMRRDASSPLHSSSRHLFRSALLVAFSSYAHLLLLFKSVLRYRTAADTLLESSQDFKDLPARLSAGLNAGTGASQPQPPLHIPNPRPHNPHIIPHKPLAAFPHPSLHRRPPSLTHLDYPFHYVPHFFVRSLHVYCFAL